MGKSGAIVTDGVNTWQATPPKIEFASAVGSGDAFVAAFIDAFMRGESIDEALLWGTAAGTANASTYRAGFLQKSSIIGVRQETILTRID
jgi:fructose-1-phosphate kinase PfkB-like protein